jgi:outer membrane protein TolC
MKLLFRFAQTFVVCAGTLAWTTPLLAGEAALGFDEAARLAATAQDPALERFDARAASLEERAVADSALPDPTVRAGLANFPTDTLRDVQEPMTQYQVGLRQEFLPGDTLTLRGRKRQAEAKIERQKKNLLVRRIVFDVRQAWLDLYHAEKARQIVKANLGALQNLAGAQTGAFASGASSSQDVFRADLEISLMQDRLAALSQRKENAAAELARYIGAQSRRPPAANLPELNEPRSPDELKQALAAHPAIDVERAAELREDVRVDLAKEAYKPSWSVDAGYGYRAGGRADFASVGLTFSIPLFTHGRQDRSLSAAMKERQAARLNRRSLLKDLERELTATLADWQELARRLQLYERAVTQRAREAATASLGAYADGRSDFPEIIRDRLAVLDAELTYLDLQIDRAKTWAKLSYLAGDPS